MKVIPESDSLSIDIRVIKERVKSIESLMDILVVSSRDSVLPIFQKFFGRSKNMAKVYIATNGERTVNEIVEVTTITRQHVSSFLVKLHMAGMITKERIGNESYYQKKKWDELVGLSLSLRQKFGIDDI